MVENLPGIPESILDSALVMDVLLTLALAYLVVRALTFLMERVSERAWKYRITVKMALPILKFSIYGVAFYHILRSILEVSTLELVAFSGVLGAAVGFGLKDVLAGVVGGLVITLDKPYQVGDKIWVGEHYGEVKDIGLRATRLVTPDDSLVSVPNLAVLSNAVANANSGDQEMMVVVDLFVDQESDAVLAMDILREAVVTSRYVYLTEKRPVTVLLRDFPLYRRVRAKGYVYDLRHEFDFESDVTRRAWVAYDRAGIEPPKGGIGAIGPMGPG